MLKSTGSQRVRHDWATKQQQPPTPGVEPWLSQLLKSTYLQTVIGPRVSNDLNWTDKSELQGTYWKQKKNHFLSLSEYDTKYITKEVLEAILQTEGEPALKEIDIIGGRVNKQRSLEAFFS